MYHEWYSVGGSSTAVQFSKQAFFILQPVKARTLVMFHSTFSKKKSRSKKAVHFTYNPPSTQIKQLPQYLNYIGAFVWEIHFATKKQ